MRRESWGGVAVWAGLLLAGWCLVGTPRAFAQHVVEAWGTVPIPPAPELKTAVVDPGKTALLILDIQRQICNADRQPRCVAMVPRIQRFLTEARGRGMAVVFSLAGDATPADILKEVAPREGEPSVRSGPDKFLGTELEAILKGKGIQSVIVVGTAANGAVLHTAAAAAFRGVKVILPVDGMTSGPLYAEQYAVWHLLNAPRVSALTTPTSLDRIRFP